VVFAFVTNSSKTTTHVLQKQIAFVTKPSIQMIIYPARLRRIMSEQYHPAGAATVFWNQYRRKHELYYREDFCNSFVTDWVYIRDVKGREPMPVEYSEAMT